MPYCSIEEAWGTNFQGSKEKSNTFSNMEYTGLSNPNEDEYVSVDFNQKSLKKDKKNYSRTMARLPGHSGPVNRYTSNKNISTLNFNSNVNTNATPNKSLVMDAQPSYLNLETPINQYDIKKHNQLLKKQIKNDNLNYGDYIEEEVLDKQSNLDEYESDDDNYGEDNSYDSDNQTSDEPVNEPTETSVSSRNTQSSLTNKSYKNKKNIDKSINNLFKNNDKNDNFYDIVIYIVTGIFIIFILDIFTKLGKNSN